MSIIVRYIFNVRLVLLDKAFWDFLCVYSKHFANNSNLY